MYFQAIKTAGLAHVSYLLGDEGEALVVDPRRDLEVYLDALRAQGLRLRYVLQTHRQEDLCGWASTSGCTSAVSPW